MRKLQIILVSIAFLGFGMQLKAQTCNDVPVINSFSPDTGFIGSVVTIVGANFDATNIANNVVYFGSTKATVKSATFGKLEVIVPVGASTAPISVTNQCKLTAYSKVSFNGIFCPTPLTNQTYQNRSFDLTGVYGAYNMLSQDMDLDGRPEVISGGIYGITIAINNSTPGNLNFGRYNYGRQTRGIAVADFDGDGYKDIVTTYDILKNTSTGPGNFGLQRVTDSRGVSGYQVGAGDFNNDGKIDIIGSNGNGIYIAFNTSTGPGNFNFTGRQYIANTGHCTGIQVADVDGDGKTDFLGSQGPYNRAVSIRNTTAKGSLTASFEAPEYWYSGGQYPYRAMIADFDKDGKIDFTSCNYNGATNTAIWRNTSVVGNISFAPTVNLVAPRNNYRIGVGDVDGDGYPDIVTKSLGVNVFSVYKNTSSAPGTPTFAARIDYSSSWQAEVSGIVIGDLDGDFVPDIATSGISSNRIIFHRNTSAQVDNTAPTASAKDIVVALDPNGTVTITADMVDNGSSDACGLDNIAISKSTFDCNDIGENTVILTVTDAAGNVSTAEAIVNVQPAAIVVSGQTTVCQGETVTMTANDGDSYQWSKDGVLIDGATEKVYVASSSGAYTVEVTNAGGCSGISIPTNVVVNDNPTVDITPSGSAYLCPPDGSQVLVASESSIYQWFKDGVAIPDATLRELTVTSVGSYSVEVIDLFGCSATSEAVIIKQNPPEIDVTGDGNYGNVYPGQDNTKTITIANSGNGDLDVNVSFTGADAQYFSTAFTSQSIAANGSVSFDVVFNAPNITTYSATLVITSNDCDESTISIPLDAEITCLGASFDGDFSNVSVSNDADVCGAAVSYETPFVGNPSPSLSYTFSGATTGSGDGNGSGSTFNIGETTVTVTVENVCGSDTKSFVVTVSDTQAPSLVTKDLTLVLANGVVNFTAADFDNGTSDNCDFTLSVDKTSFTCNDIGDNTVIVTATDSSGNATSAAATVTVVGDVPTVSISDFTAVPTQKENTIFLGYGPQSISLSTVVSGGSGFTYDWSSSTGESVDAVANPTVSPTETTTYSVVVTNANGCSAYATFKVCVIDARSFNKKGKPDGKVIVCHHAAKKSFPISISKNAVAAHLQNHGDTLGDCSATCSTSNAKNVVTDIVNENGDLDFGVYPNPTKGTFNVKLPKVSGDVVVEVYTMFGKLIQKQTISKTSKISTLKLGSSTLKTGVYVVKITSNNVTTTKNVIIQN